MVIWRESERDKAHGKRCRRALGCEMRGTRALYACMHVLTRSTCREEGGARRKEKKYISCIITTTLPALRPRP